MEELQEGARPSLSVLLHSALPFKTSLCCSGDKVKLQGICLGVQSLNQELRGSAEASPVASDVNGPCPKLWNTGEDGSS